MSMKRIDARGLSCPQPVVLTQKGIQEGHDALEVTVDNEVSKENILRLAKKSRMKSEIRKERDDIVIIIEK
jgi:tRNA 2-thiouridine synthesizing protein A